MPSIVRRAHAAPWEETAQLEKYSGLFEIIFHHVDITEQILCVEMIVSRYLLDRITTREAVRFICNEAVASSPDNRVSV